MDTNDLENQTHCEPCVTFSGPTGISTNACCLKDSGSTGSRSISLSILFDRYFGDFLVAYKTRHDRLLGNIVSVQREA